MDPFCYLWFMFFFVMLSRLCITPVVTWWERADLLALCVFVCCLRVCHLPIWCPGSGVALDCISS